MPAIDGVLFTGCAQTGVALNRQFADQPEKILALEMGGNNPLVVWDAPDIHAAATIVVQSAFISAGQRCTARAALIVEDGDARAVIDAIVQAGRPDHRRRIRTPSRRRSWAR